MLLPHVDPDARAPRDRSELQSAILEVQARAEQIGVVLCQRDPQGFRQIAGTSAKILIARHNAAPAAHHLEPVDRIERANQHRRRRSPRFGDDVHHPVDAVVQVYVGVAGVAVHRRVPRSWPRCGVAGWIGLADVRFHLDDGAARTNAAPIMNQHFAQ
jgi:hypothetical protein